MSELAAFKPADRAALLMFVTYIPDVSLWLPRHGAAVSFDASGPWWD
jgi:hypothetical protein